jgi:hypothetical protein
MYSINSSQITAFKKSSGSGDVSQLPELHAMTSGLKAYVSTTTVDDIEIARRSMGGHGYSAFSGLGKLYANYLPAVTYVYSCLLCSGNSFSFQVRRGQLCTRPASGAWVSEGLS